MSHGVCLLSSIPGRKSASDSSEMVTQILFGETYSVIEEEEKFIKIQLSDDQYECWICIKQHNPILKDHYEELNKMPKQMSYELISIVENVNESVYFPIVIGSQLLGITEQNFSINNQNFSYDGELTNEEKSNKNKIVQDAFMYLNAPYLWGGKSPMGIDCSGFTQMVYKLNGVMIPRDASQQVDCGEPYSFVEESEPGDLAFFDNGEGKIVHVGIVIGNKKIIHASGKVRVDKIDHYGIFNSDTNKYSHKLRLIKKLI